MSAATSAWCRPRGWSAKRCSPSRWRTPGSRSSAATASPRCAATTTATSLPSPADIARQAGDCLAARRVPPARDCPLHHSSRLGHLKPSFTPWPTWQQIRQQFCEARSPRYAWRRTNLGAAVTAAHELTANEYLRRRDDHQGVIQRLAGKAAQGGDDALEPVLTRPLLGQLHQDDACMRRWKLADVPLQVVVLRDQGCARPLCIPEHVRIRTIP